MERHRILNFVFLIFTYIIGIAASCCCLKSSKKRPVLNRAKEEIEMTQISLILNEDEKINESQKPRPLKLNPARGTKNGKVVLPETLLSRLFKSKKKGSRKKRKKSRRTAVDKDEGFKNNSSNSGSQDSSLYTLDNVMYEENEAEPSQLSEDEEKKQTQKAFTPLKIPSFTNAELDELGEFGSQEWIQKCFSLMIQAEFEHEKDLDTKEAEEKISSSEEETAKDDIRQSVTAFEEKEKCFLYPKDRF